MEWSDDFESGLADIDAQHRMIVALAQRVQDLEERRDAEALALAIQELMRFARAHFACEEQLMLAYDYPGTAQHRIEHQSLLQELAHECTLATSRELVLFLCKWLMSHALLEDRRLAQHILKIRAEALGMSIQELSAHITTGGTPLAQLSGADRIDD